MHIHLLVPDFFSDEGVPPPARLDAAETLVSKGRRKRAPASSAQAWLFGRFQVPKQRDWPVAPYTLLADGGSPERHFWIRADPVHLRVGNNALVLVEGPALGVSRAEAEALAETLNRHFGEILRLRPMDAGRWYARMQPAPEVETTPPAAAGGKEIKAHLPSGRDAVRLHALMNETQMLLHEHPVNTARETRGEPELNSVWFWGGGVMETAAARPFSAVIADDPLARGLALAAGIPARPLPENANLILPSLRHEGVALAVFDAPRGADGLAALERTWFAPLLAALRAGEIGMLTLHLCGADSLLEVETVRSDLRRFWRRNKPLASHFA